ncbi:hypothetical protein FHS82_000064 [Pseudochelatococcus lubricantis]|uniref:Uncharacterized protein n=1 Tax=Pseudochelatococcus lubricantis TaxID=1538102 RepID=A0ABX0UTG5_9HYPH|nr:hypothetical protein [Pseudochelatococcus lubricantis]NIJ56251.1 hypothetical protein [Pseudochelatococcus lubricantis]
MIDVADLALARDYTAKGDRWNHLSRTGYFSAFLEPVRHKATIRVLPMKTEALQHLHPAEKVSLFQCSSATHPWTFFSFFIQSECEKS